METFLVIFFLVFLLLGFATVFIVIWVNKKFSKELDKCYESGTKVYNKTLSIAKTNAERITSTKHITKHIATNSHKTGATQEFSPKESRKPEEGKVKVEAKEPSLNHSIMLPQISRDITQKREPSALVMGNNIYDAVPTITLATAHYVENISISEYSRRISLSEEDI